MDIRIALRHLTARPAYTMVIILTLALGIGAATAVFSVVDQTVLRPAPFAEAHRLVDVLHIDRNTGGGGSSLTPQKIVGWQSQPALFDRFEGYMYQQMDVTGEAEPERLGGLKVSIGLFPMLEVKPRLGRGFQHGDGAPGSERVVIISDALWQRRFGGDADVIGRQILLNNENHTIMGVMPRRFRLMDEKESFWLPVDLQSHIANQNLGGFYGLGRLAPGVAHAAAQAMADAIAERLQQESPLPLTWGLGLERKRVARVDETTRTALLVLLGAVGFVLLITCANVANLYLSQAPVRQREMAIRSALGAGRGQLVRSVLAESLLLATAGGILGIVLAQWGVEAILAAAPERLVWRSTTPIEIDSRVLGVAALLTVATGFIFGLFPALRGSRPNLETTLRGAAQSRTRSSYGRLPGSLVVVEVAFAMILLVGAALMMRTLANLHAIDSGFDANGVITMHVALPSDHYPSLAARIAFFDSVSEKLRGVPGISGVAASQGTPPSIGSISFGKPEIEGRAPSNEKPAIIPNGLVSPDYFRTLGIPLLAGRGFGTMEASDVVIVSKGFADKYWPNENAVGGRFRMGSRGPWLTVVGIVGSVQASAARDDLTTIQYYYAWTRRPVPAAGAASAESKPPRAGVRRERSYDYRQLIVKAENPAAAIPLIKQQIWTIDPNQPVERVALVADTYAEMFAKQRFLLLLMGAFAGVALVLTAAGIFGVLSQAVAQRTREIGIRVALGAKPADVMKLVVSRGILLATLGVVIGTGTALALVRTVQALLYGVSATDPVSFAGVTVLLLAVALLACWLPTRAAMRVHPAVALRVE